jgi:hypothetical protein
MLFLNNDYVGKRPMRSMSATSPTKRQWPLPQYCETLPEGAMSTDKFESAAL